MMQGSIAALVTPMYADGSLDLDSMTVLVERQIQEKTDVIVILGSTGEAATLSIDERTEVIKRVVQVSAGRIPVVVGTGHSSTKVSIELSLHAQSLGANAVLLVTPFYNKPTQEGLYQHHRMVSDAVTIPQILYNIPSRTGCDMLPETVCRLSHVPGIIAIKESSHDPVARWKEIAALDLAEGFFCFSGDDPLTCDMIKAGSRGVISVAANVVPHSMFSICQLMLNHEEMQARAIDQTLQSLYHDLFLQTNPIPVKWALHRMGLIKSFSVRMPLLPFQAAYIPQMEATLSSLSLIS